MIETCQCREMHYSHITTPPTGPLVNRVNDYCEEKKTPAITLLVIARAKVKIALRGQSYLAHILDCHNMAPPGK